MNKPSKRAAVSLLLAILLLACSFRSARADSGLYSWGENSLGSLGNGTYSNSNVPVAVDTKGALNGKTISAISAGGEGGSLVLTTDGQLFSWGGNSFGELGNGTNTDSNVPVAVDMSGALSGKTIFAIAAGGNQSLVLTTDGELFSWGYNADGELGNGTNTDSNVPVAVDMGGALNGKKISAISAGALHCLVLTTDGQLFSWGANGDDELGDGGTEDYSNVPVAVDMSGALNGKNISAISAGWDHNLVLTNDGQIFSWGSDFFGELGNGTNTESNVPVAVDMGGALNGKKISAISGGGEHCLVLTTDGQLFSWGLNGDDELGDGGTEEYSTVPVAVDMTGALNGKKISAISTGGYHSLVLTDDGQLVGWGHNTYGDLGNGTNTDSNVTVAVYMGGALSGKNISAISLGDYSSLVLTTDDTPPDTTPPTAKITAPGKNKTITSFPGFAATATDTGSGMAKLDFYLYRNADKMWWTGTAWGSTATALPGTAGSANTYTKIGGLPSPTSTNPTTKLTDGIYTLYARAYDNANNLTTVYSLFQMQTPIKVACTITVPKKNSTINGLPGLQAKTTDSLGGTGVKTVDFYLLRNADSKWWSGTAWGSAATAMSATQSPAGTWTKLGGMPSATSTDLTKKLTDGIYTVYARPTDIHDAVTTFSGLFQQQTPIKVSASIVAPKKNSTVTTLPMLQAKTSDSLGGTGVKSVDFYLLRNADSKFWNGTAWGSAATALPAVQSPTGTWTKTGGLPTGANLGASIYTVYLRPTDVHGAITTFSSLFQVKAVAGAAPLEPSSSLAVSSASASATAGTVTLNFASAIDVASVADPSSYVVTVDGATVAVEAASVTNAGRTVTLGLAPGALRSGSVVSISFRFAAADGSVQTGSVAITAR